MFAYVKDLALLWYWNLLSMSPHRPLRIPIAHRAEGTYQYDFELKPSFFASFAHSIIPKGKGHIHVQVQKTRTLIQVDFHIQCAIGLCCDRTLKPYTQSLDICKKMMVKFAEKEELCDENVLFLPYHTSHMTLDQHIYDYICLALPMRKLHPSEKDATVDNKLRYPAQPHASRRLGDCYADLPKKMGMVH